MIDLDVLRKSSVFCTDDEPRLAFVHHGFRSTLVQHGQNERASFTSCYPPLGILALMRQLEHDQAEGRLARLPRLRYFGESDHDDDKSLVAAVKRWLSGSRFRVLLVGVYTVALERTMRFLEHFDAAQVCIVTGGPHVTTAPDFEGAHIAVRGEGGAAVRHIVNMLLRTGFGEGQDAEGICFVDRGRAVIKKACFNRSLAEIPSPAYDYQHAPLAPQAHWARELGRSQQIYVCTQSCGARCTFCSTYFIHGSFVSRPARLVEQDLEIMTRRFGYDAIEFHDDDLLQHEEFDRVLELLRQAGVRWSCNARTKLVDAELARRMYDAGCRRVFLGLESMDQQTLDYFNKGCTVEDNERAVQALEDAGIGVITGFIIGAPHHTLESLLLELDTFLSLPIYFLAASILTPDIGTVEYRRARKAIPQLKLLESGPRRLSIRPRPELFGSQMPHGLPTVCDALSKADLNELYELIRCEFFLRSGTRARILRHTPRHRHDVVGRWYSWIEKSARTLESSADLEPVRARISTCLVRWTTAQEADSDGRARTG